jgi:hypothetical protein
MTKSKGHRLVPAEPRICGQAIPMASDRVSFVPRSNLIFYKTCPGTHHGSPESLYRPFCLQHMEGYDIGEYPGLASVHEIIVVVSL